MGLHPLLAVDCVIQPEQEGQLTLAIQNNVRDLRQHGFGYFVNGVLTRGAATRGVALATTSMHLRGENVNIRKKGSINHVKLTPGSLL